MQKTMLDLGCTRTCACPPKHINCMTAKDWMKSQVGVWRFTYNGKDIREKTKHPAVFPVALAAHVIKLFTHEGELVVDPFVGSGSTLVAAHDHDRNALGVDLSEQYVALARSRLTGFPSPNGARQEAVMGDARAITPLLEPQSVKLIFTSPPYANMLNRARTNKSRRSSDRRNGQYGKVEQYSQDKRDLGTLLPSDYCTALGEIFGGLLPVLQPAGHVVINVNDLWAREERIPLHSMVIAALQDVGYRFKNIVIWDRTNIVNRIGIFGWPSNYITMGTTFEYILHFQGPSE